MCLFVAMSEQHVPLLPVTVSCGLRSFTFHLEHRVTVCTVVCTLAHQGCTVCRSAKGGWWPYWLRAHPGLIPKCVTVLYFPMHCTLSMMLIHKEKKNRISVSQISHCTLDPCWLIPQCVTWTASENFNTCCLCFNSGLIPDTYDHLYLLLDPHPLGFVGVMSMSGLQLSHLIFYLLEPSSAKFRWGRAHLGGRWCDIGNFSLNFLAHFSPLPTFGLAKVCLTMERCKREQSYTLWTSKKKLTLSYWQVRQKKEQTSGEVCPLPEIAAGRKGNLTWH